MTSPQLTARTMTANDIAAMVALESNAVDFPWAIKILSDCLRAGHDCRIYQNATGEAVGFTVVQTILDEAHLLNICIAKAHQGKGFGRIALESVLSQAQQQSMTTVLLEVRADNRRAQQLYQTIGFNEMAVRQGYYPAKKGREDAILMAFMFI